MTRLIFEFRDDNSAVQFANVSVVNVRTGAQVTVANGNFSGGGGSTPNGWTYANVNGYTFASSPGVSSCGGSSKCWVDATYGGYDSLSQSITTAPGAVYKVSFVASVLGGLSKWAEANTSPMTGSDSLGGNGANIALFLVAEDLPEPSTWAMLTIGFVGLGYLGWRRRGRAQA